MKLQNLTKYKSVDSSTVFRFEGEAKRKIRLEMLLPQPDIISITTGKTTVEVGFSEGQHTLEFVAEGITSISADRMVYIYTADVEKIHLTSTAEKYTKVHMREKRSPEFEAMSREVFHNSQRMIERMFQQMQREIVNGVVITGDGEIHENDDIANGIGEDGRKQSSKPSDTSDVDEKPTEGNDAEDGETDGSD